LPPLLVRCAPLPAICRSCRQFDALTAWNIEPA
jgi:hypothetical protein